MPRRLAFALIAVFTLALFVAVGPVAAVADDRAASREPSPELVRAVLSDPQARQLGEQVRSLKQTRDALLANGQAPDHPVVQRIDAQLEHMLDRLDERLAELGYDFGEPPVELMAPPVPVAAAASAPSTAAATAPATQVGHTQSATMNMPPADLPTALGHAFVAAVEAAHQADTYRAQQAIRADLVVEGFGAGRIIEGTVWFDPAAGRTRIVNQIDGATIVFDGDTCWVRPTELANPTQRFHSLTWPYFVALPYKLADPGSTLRYVGQLPAADGDTYDAAKLTFDPGVGDAPDDYYFVMADDQGVVRAASYIVTFGKDVEEAKQQESIVLYQDFAEVEGVPFATRMTFGFWNATDGMTGEPKGTATLDSIAFVDAPADLFTKPDGAAEIPLP